MHVYDDNGQPYDSRVEIVPAQDGYTITFESGGGGRNRHYISAFGAVMARLCNQGAVLMDACLATGDTKHLSLEQRRLRLKELSYPIQLFPRTDSLALASQLRSAQARTAREKGARGTGNRTKRTEIRFSVAPDRASLDHVLQSLLNPSDNNADVASLKEFVSPRPSGGEGQRFLSDPAARRAVELYAMSLATAHFEKLGAHVTDVSRTECVDLRCELRGETFDVEVKGTTTSGGAILLTRNEVEHARRSYPRIVLFVVSGISVDTVSGKPVAGDGCVSIHHPWKLDDTALRVETYSLRLG